MNLSVTDFLRAEIARKGAVSFHEFMTACLYHVEDGYYSSGKALVGRKGDFFTNVSVGDTFGKLIAKFFCECWQELGEPKAFTILEQGANDGQFADDVLKAIRRDFPKIFDCMNYLIVEPFEALEKKQREKLGERRNVSWVRKLDELGDGSITGVMFSNELVDAFPVHRVRFENGKWMEFFVKCEGEKFAWEMREIGNEKLLSEVSELPQVEGYIAEINLEAEPWMKQVARVLGKGFVLTVDYGFLSERLYHPAREQGTLQCYHQHRKHDDPLVNIGEQDISCHVNFSKLITSGEQAGLTTDEFTDQHHFLIHLAKDILLADEQHGTQTLNMRAFQTLIHPELMGTQFKYLVQKK